MKILIFMIITILTVSACRFPPITGTELDRAKVVCERQSKLSRIEAGLSWITVTCGNGMKIKISRTKTGVS